MEWNGMRWDEIDRKLYLITVTLFKNYNITTLHFWSSQKP